MENIELPEIKPNEQLIDPDPFAIALALMGLIFGGGSYLEARRQRQYLERQAKEEFRKIWYDCKRTLIHARRVVEEFSTYASEEEFGKANFLFGTIKLTISPEKAQQLRRLHGNAQTTATHMADNLDDLSAYLSEEYKPLIEAIHGKLQEQQLPHTYDAVIILARETIELYDKLIAEVGKKEGFIEILP